MIISNEIKVDLFLNDDEYVNISLDRLELLLSPYKEKVQGVLHPKETLSINNAYICFSDDDEKHVFYCKIYKTSVGPDIWILLLADKREGYALYKNPLTNKLELAWYRSDLQEPLSKEMERMKITCYIPK